jgi:hypothetical protein
LTEFALKLDLSCHFILYNRYHPVSSWPRPEIDPCELPVCFLSTNPQRVAVHYLSGCSGAATDRRHAMAMLAANHPNDPIDVIMGDWYVARR